MDPGFTPHQLHLNVSIREDATLNNFYLSADSKNAEVIATLKQQLPTKQGAIFYLWGASSSGLTHLLHGACHFAKSQSQASVYLPLAEVSGYEPYALLEGLENNQLVCLDDLHKVTGNQQWEQAIFDLYNRILESNHHLIVSANQGPHELTILLPDLRSRLSAGHSYQIQALADQDKPFALRQNAKARGMDMSDEVAQFILSRAPRDMNALFDILEHLDEMTLSAQRKLTIPFVKTVLDL